MKKLLTILAIFFSIHFAQANPEKNPKNELTEAQKIEMAQMEKRLEEIKSLDFRSMEKEEIKAIRSELKEMKEQARATGNGVYLSVGAIIIIILLLILLL